MLSLKQCKALRPRPALPHNKAQDGERCRAWASSRARMLNPAQGRHPALQEELNRVGDRCPRKDRVGKRDDD